jgi:flagellar assembly protein FliH
MSEALPRSRQSAWQRWELASLAEAEARLPEPSAEERAQREAAEAMARAQAEGEARGFAAGMAVAQQRVAELERVLARLSDHAANHEQRLADEVLDLALLFARQIAGQAVAIKRELVLPVVATALAQLPQATRHIELHLDPADVALVRSVIPADHAGPPIAIVADPRVGPGGCLVDTDQASVDATLGSRWRRLLGSLGRTDDWID